MELSLDALIYDIYIIVFPEIIDWVFLVSVASLIFHYVLNVASVVSYVSSVKRITGIFLCSLRVGVRVTNPMVVPMVLKVN